MQTKHRLSSRATKRPVVKHWDMISIHSVANLASAVVKDLQPALPCLSQTSVGCFDKRAGGGGVTKGLWLSKRSKADWYKQ